MIHIQPDLFVWLSLLDSKDPSVICKRHWVPKKIVPMALRFSILFTQLFLKLVNNPYLYVFMLNIDSGHVWFISITILTDFNLKPIHFGPCIGVSQQKVSRIIMHLLHIFLLTFFILYDMKDFVWNSRPLSTVIYHPGTSIGFYR